MERTRTPVRMTESRLRTGLRLWSATLIGERNRKHDCGMCVRCTKRLGFDGDDYHEPLRVPTACWRSVTFCHSRHHPPLDTPLVTHACAKEQAAGQHYFDNSKGTRVL
jgi:hypothetical protein